MNGYNSGNANDVEQEFILEVKDIDRVENCVKTAVKNYRYRKYKEVYEVNLNALKIIITNCDEIMNGFIKLLQKDKKIIKKTLSNLVKTKNKLFVNIDKNDKNK